VGMRLRFKPQMVYALCDIYTIWKLECCKCARMRFHCAGGLVVLRSCAPQRETLLVVTDFCSRGFYQTLADLVTLSRSHLRSTPQAPFHHRHHFIANFAQFPHHRHHFIANFAQFEDKLTIWGQSFCWQAVH